jgi:hypothetical protein
MCMPLDDVVGDEQASPSGPDLPFVIAPDERSFQVRVPPQSEVTASAVLQDRRTGAIRVSRCHGMNPLDSAALVSWVLGPEQPDDVVRDVGHFVVRQL